MNSSTYSKWFFLPVSFLLAGFCFAQKTDFSIIEKFLDISANDSAIFYLNQLDTSKLNDNDKAIYYYYLGDAYFGADKHQIAYKNLLKALDIYSFLKKSKKTAETNFKIGLLLSHQKNSDIRPYIYFDKYIQWAKRQNDPKKLDSAYTRIAIQYLHNDKGKKALTYFDKALEQAKKSKDTLRVAIIKFNKAVTYKVVLKAPDSALYEYKEALSSFIKYDKKQYISYTYNNLAELYKNLQDYPKAIAYYKKADSIPFQKFKAKTKIIYYENISDVYIKSSDYKNATIYFQKLIQLKDSINNNQQNIEISKIKEKYENQKLKNENLIVDAKRVKNLNWLIAAISLLFITAIIAILIYKNTKRKQRIAEQEREIEIQKTEKILKEQELNTIDAMLSGQEKERQRLANDLHDNLGSTLATIKLHFDHLKNNQNNPKVDNKEEIFAKTEALLNQAYQKVRTIAHEKNSGVMANQGLLPAIQKLVNSISRKDGLQISIQDFGLDERLDNHIEITIFRIIQELITNVIKHAKASEINISLTNHDQNLTIIIEDNGCGFDPKMLPKKEGMGLSSIEKRVESLEGTFEIDSTIHQGTSIILNIPI